MAYQFVNQIEATSKIRDDDGTGDTFMSFAGVNGRVASADEFVSGIKGFLYIANMDDSYEATEMTRTVTQNVRNE